jgi:hypothetical protein
MGDRVIDAGCGIRNRFAAIGLIGWAALAMGLAGCAVKPQFPEGKALLQGEDARWARPPGCQRAELELSVFQGRRKTSLSAVLTVAPYRAYKLDLFGLPGMLVASFLWHAGEWTLVIHDQETYRTGKGERVALENLGIGPVSVHDLFSFLWGDFFPGLSDTAGLPVGFTRGNDGTLRYAAGGMNWVLALDPRTGLVREALREDSSLHIAYGDYRVMHGRPAPRRVQVSSRGRLLLEIRLKNLEDNPTLRRDPFLLKIPPAYREGTPPGPLPK